ncbi:N-anthranilate isomerase [Obba rivulosa]|uniref:Multifunctional tryptophan biosynthesis protein n=1 Tax=Obba rivulosa TaxID=1052685 RepID=A0A8E2DLX1_9APHY|nr:N-anthranilate isomerase [Obba rivulosa]
MPLSPALDRPLDVLLIDNFDSFTWNLYQSLCLIGADVTVVRNDAIDPADFPLLRLNFLIISPGPGHPMTDSGVSREAIKYFAGKIPVLGVCMGLECLVDAFGGTIAYAGEIMHGKVSPILHDGRGVFLSLPQRLPATRYHSLGASLKTLPSCLAVTATTAESGVVMGVRHRTYTLEAVQYHPESILSEGGDKLLENFLKLRGGTWKENPEFRVGEDDPPFNVPGPSVNGASTSASQAGKAPTILEKIYARRMQDVDVAKATPGTTSDDLRSLLALELAPPLTSFYDRLRNAARSPALMAEIKRASPSKGAIALSANAAQQALDYALAGASVISVLTEPTWFRGTLLDMRLARQAVDALSHRPAILRKDFIFDEYQIMEARLHGADSVLLIVAMLSKERLHALYACAKSFGMEPLVEVNNAQEMATALELGARVVGVNNRNLHSFEVDMGTTSRLVDMVKERDVVLCALSGITGPKDVQTYQQQGVRAVLVGEALMRAKDTRAFVRELLDWPEEKEQHDADVPPLVKICGIRTPEEAQVAIEAGADMLGLMFAAQSKRRISLAQASAIAASVRSSRLARPAAEGSDSDITTSQEEEPNASWFAAHARRLRATLASPTSRTRPLLVGVFQNQPLSLILRAVAEVQLDAVQLHGTEPAEWAHHIPVPTIRVFHVSPEAPAQGLAGLTRPGGSEFVLLDAVRPGEANGVSGGTGLKLDWDLARSVVQRGEVGAEGAAVGEEGADETGAKVKRKGWMPIILAGGLTPDNVREAVEKVRPWAVDVSGGVESGDGRSKDLDKVRAFVKAAKDV